MIRKQKSGEGGEGGKKAENEGALWGGVLESRKSICRGPAPNWLLHLTKNISFFHESSVASVVVIMKSQFHKGVY